MDSHSLIRTGSLLLLLIVLHLLHMPGACGQGLTLENLQETYKNSKPGTLVCYYDGSLCQRDKQICSPRTRTCEKISLFKEDAADKEKLKICKQYINNDTMIDPQVYDACIYIIGSLTAKGAVKCDMNLTSLILTRPVGKDLCPYVKPSEPDEFYFCKRGKEYCTSSGCEPLFNNSEISDDEKRARCLEVVKHKEASNKQDSCLYALGSLGSLSDKIQKLMEEHHNDVNSTLKDLHAKIDALKREKESTANPCDDALEPWHIAVIVIAVILVAIVCGLGLYICYSKKLACFKEPKQAPFDAEAPAGAVEDVNQEGRALREDVQRRIVADDQDPQNDNRDDADIHERDVGQANGGEGVLNDNGGNAEVNEDRDDQVPQNADGGNAEVNEDRDDQVPRNDNGVNAEVNEDRDNPQNVDRGNAEVNQDRDDQVPRNDNGINAEVNEDRDDQVPRNDNGINAEVNEDRDDQIPRNDNGVNAEVNEDRDDQVPQGVNGDDDEVNADRIDQVPQDIDGGDTDDDDDQNDNMNETDRLIHE